MCSEKWANSISRRHSRSIPLVRPPLDELQRAAKVLAQAKNPAILAGSRVLESDAVDELVKFAELLGAPGSRRIGHDARPARLSLHASPLSPGMPVYAPEIHPRLSEFDALFVVGMDSVPAVRLFRAGSSGAEPHPLDPHGSGPVGAWQELPDGSQRLREPKTGPRRAGGHPPRDDDSGSARNGHKARPRTGRNPSQNAPAVASQGGPRVERASAYAARHDVRTCPRLPEKRSGHRRGRDDN